MEAHSLLISLPGEAASVALTSHDEALAGVTLPTALCGADDINLDESRSESSKSSSERKFPTGGVLGPDYSPDPIPDDAASDEYPAGEAYSTGGSRGAGVMKRAWQQEEDDRLVQLVTSLGPCHWSVIASHLEGRVGKQCRERCAQSQIFALPKPNFRRPQRADSPARALAAGTITSLRRSVRRIGPMLRIGSLWSSFR